MGVNINTFTKKQILAKISEFLKGQRQYFMVTPNPEIILEAVRRDNDFFNILNKADLSLPDGAGLKIAAWFLGENLPKIAGADLLKDILDMAEKQNRRVAVFNWQDGLSSSSEISRSLADKYPNLHMLALDVGRQTVIHEDGLARAAEFKPEIIFSTFGAPYQEKFIFNNLSNLPSVKFGVGVGGGFDFLTGKSSRAPKVMRTFGLEWLWRLYKQPSRWRRIYNAVMVFPVEFLIWRFKIKS